MALTVAHAAAAPGWGSSGNVTGRTCRRAYVPSIIGYKNWRGIPKPRRCPFCKKVKGEIRKVSRVFRGSCTNCGATGPRRESRDEALRAWNGKELKFLAQ